MLLTGRSSLRPRRRWRVAGTGGVAAAALAILLVQAHARDPEGRQPAAIAPSVAYERAIPDDMVLLEQLAGSDRAAPARGLRPRARRARPGRADRARDADRGGLRAPRARHRHALRRRRRAVRLPVPPGERLGRRRRGPRRDRLHAAAAPRASRARPAAPTPSAASAATRRAAPTAPACRRRTRSCAATASASAAPISATRRTCSASVRSRLLAREMSAELQAAGGGAPPSARGARDGGSSSALTTKGVSFGRIARRPGRPLDYGAVEGVDADLTIRPVRLEGPSGDAARHGRGVAPHPPGTAVAAHPAGGARRHARRRRRTDTGAVVRPRRRRRHARDRLRAC